MSKLNRASEYNIPNRTADLTINEIMTGASITEVGTLVEIHKELPDGSIVHVTFVRPPKKAIKISKNDKKRSDEVMELYKEGFSITVISTKLNMPRNVVKQLVKDKLKSAISHVPLEKL